jgi:hypothetical protein
MMKRLFLIIILIAGINAYAQESNCRVLYPEISGTYSGDCKRGLAHGKGIAQGIDRYEGHFSKGNPNGIGTYIKADGTSYEGQWKRGVKEGKGKMVYKDSIVEGYWKNDKYIGEKLIPPYSIKSSLSVARSSIKKTSGTMDEVRIRFLQAGGDNGGISGLSIVPSSGDQFQTGAVYGIQNILYPVNVNIRYRTWNLMHTTQFNVLFEFVINEPGTWDVAISN